MVIFPVRISPWGYGKAIYINYNNGLTSVYAHCSSFPPLLDSLIYSIQKNQESAIIDEDISSLRIPVKRGDVVAFSGNSGSSSAPHLHFEIRETRTEHAINPLLFDCYRQKIKDSTPPEIRGLKIYGIHKNGYLIPGKSIYLPVKKNGKSYSVNDNQPIDVSKLRTENSFIGIGVYAIDKLDAAYNNCGIYSSKVFQNDSVMHYQEINYMNFDVNRYLNTHKDYFAFRHLKQHIHKQFTTDINPLPIYPLKNGLIHWEKAATNYKVLIKDVHQNKSTLSFKLSQSQDSSLTPNPLTKENYYFPNTVNTINFKGFEAILESGQFYEPVQKKTSVTESTNSSFLTSIYQLFEYDIPVQSGINMRIKIPENAKHLSPQKMGIVLLDNKRRIYFQGGKHDQGWISHEIRHFGKFTLMIDTVAPVIKPYDYKQNQNIAKYSTLEFNLSDNLSGIASYKVYLNDMWVLAYYDRKKKRYIVPLNQRSKKHLKKGKNTLVVRTIDKVKNMSEQTVTLIY